jgi:hypothetical protein
MLDRVSKFGKARQNWQRHALVEKNLHRETQC